MNLTRMAIVFVLITMPFMVVSYVEVLGLQRSEQTRQQYSEIINNAINDSATTLKQSIETIENEGVRVNAQEVVASFLASYHYGFNVIGESDKIRLNQHILALVVLDYDGFYIYGTREVTEPSGAQVLRPVISEKYYYSYLDSHYLMHVTLDDYVRVLDLLTLEEEKGFIDDISSLPVGISLVDYNHHRQKVIRDSLTNALNYTVSVHNRYTEYLGVTYEFYIPLSDENAWASNIDDLGVIAFIQGHPLGGGQNLDVMKFGRSAVMLEDQVVGYIDMAGNPYYCDTSCTHPIADPEVKIFASPREAAMEGFYPCHMVGK